MSSEVKKSKRAKRTKTPSFILELPLVVSKKEEKELLSRFESARNIYNACLGYAKRKVYLVKQSKAFQKARKISKSDKNKAIRKEAFQIARDAYDYDEYAIHKYACELRHNLVNDLDIHTVQKLETRAFKATEKIIFGTAKKVRFKGYNQFDSVESKSNVTGIRWRDNVVEWNGLALKPVIKIEDEVISYSLKHRVKYCRIFRKEIKGKNRFYIQLILEGKPYVKAKNKMGKGTVCYDIGPSTVAIVALNDNNEFNAKLTLFCSELDIRQKEITRLQRHIDRQRRQNNPNNYSDGNGKGKIKRGRLIWKKSKRQLENEKELRELFRVVSSHRKSLHGKLANETIRMGNVFKTEKLSKKWLQKNFGKSIGIRAPAMYTSFMKRKAESAGGSHDEISTVQTMLSQSCHCGARHKKKLSDRIHDCICGIYCQRDLFSAYLGIFVDKTGEKYILQAAEASRLWTSADKLLQTAWQDAVESTTSGTCPASFGKPKAFQSQSRSFAKDRIAKLKVQNVVLGGSAEESLKESEAFPSEPAGF